MTPLGPAMDRLPQPGNVSVVIPAYQRVQTIARAVTSALLQTSPPYEVIVVDDGSTDGTGDVARNLGARVVTQTNQGVSAARNAGLRAASSDWVALLDGDDEWLPHHLETLTTHAGEHDLVGSLARAVPSGRLVGRPASGCLIIGPRDAVWPELPVSPTATMIRRKAALAAGGFSPLILSEDLDLWIKLLQNGTGLLVPEVTCLYIEHADQATRDKTAMRDSRRDVLERYRGEQWCGPGLLDAVATADAWDDLRSAQRAHKPATVVSSLLRLLSRPGAIGALIQTLRYRAAVRSA